MKRILIPLIIILGIGGIVAILMRNKAVSLEKAAKSDVLAAPAVTCGTVEKAALETDLSLVGTTVAWNDVNVVAETAGRVTAVKANAGDHVNAGAILVQLDDELKKAALETAETNYDKAKKDLQRYTWLKQEKSMQDATLENAQLAVKSAEAQYIVAKRQLADTRVVSPVPGTLTSRLVDLGAYVQQGAVIGNVVDISRLKVKLNVAEKDAFRIHAGDKVEITSEVYPAVTFQGIVNSISDKGDEAHTYPVEIHLTNGGKNPLRAGMFVRAAFTAIPHTQALTIPREALVGSVRDPHVYVVENNVAHLRPLVIGDVSDAKLEVRQGLNEGERVVVSGQNNLRDGMQVTVVQ